MVSLWIAACLTAVFLSADACRLPPESCIDQYNRLQQEYAGAIGGFLPWCDENDNTRFGPVHCYCAWSFGGRVIGDYKDFDIGSSTC
ncbi:hypothetical protein BaRGS_00026669, partial [Batillaria attramentaria]